MQRGYLDREPEWFAEAFTCACMLRGTDDACYLLDKAVDHYAGMKTGLSGFHYAVSCGQPDTVKMLIENTSRWKLEYVRRLTDDVAIVQVSATRKEPVILPDGTKIPPFTQWVTFVVVKQKDEWRIASHNIHNQFADPHRSEVLPWRSAQTKK